MRAPFTSISITPRNLAGGEAISSSLVCASARRPDSPAVSRPLSPSIRTGTKLGRLDAGSRRKLVSPYREQPAHNAMASRHLGNVDALREALSYDQSLLLRRPPSPPPLSRNHLDTTIRVTFLHGFMDGICHPLTSNNQFMPGCIAGESADREVGASCRLRSIDFAMRRGMLIISGWAVIGDSGALCTYGPANTGSQHHSITLSARAHLSQPAACQWIFFLRRADCKGPYD
jgi:hypothetical protein